MSRCFICDSTSDGQMSLRPFKRARNITPDKERPWLDICSDCSYFGMNGNEVPVMQEGEIPNLEPYWDE